MSQLYFARVAPTPAQKEQVNGGGFLWRYKVRIFDKHPQDKSILADEDLPWAQVLLPVTAGSGAANYSVTPQINAGDTVSIAYYDAEQQMPVITGILPRTEEVSNGEPDGSNGFVPQTGFSERKDKSAKTVPDESNESASDSQPTTPARNFSNVVGDTLIAADASDPNGYKINAIISEINNLLNQLQRAGSNANFSNSLIQGAVDRIHALVNPYVGDMFNNVFNELVPILNRGLKALYEKIYKIVFATTQNPLAARLAAEAAMVALVPAVQALQEAISLLAAEVVSKLLGTVEDLINDTVANNSQFSECAGTQVTAALVNAIIQEIEIGLGPLLAAVAEILTGGFRVGTAIRSSTDLVKDFSSGLLSPGQLFNGGAGVRQYTYGVGPTGDIGDILEEVLAAANTAKSLVAEEADAFTNTFGDFPILSGGSNAASDLAGCTTAPPQTCFAPTVTIFGGRGEGALARPIVGNYVRSTDSRTVSSVQGGIVAVEVIDGGSGYSYPPFVDISDNCRLGRGARAQAVIKDGKVTKIYVVAPGEDYPADGEELFVVDDVEVIDGGSGYAPGIVRDEFGGEYELVTDDNGTVTAILPINIVQMPGLPTIRVPEITPPIPPGKVLKDGCIYDVDGTIFTCDVKVGRGLLFKPLLIKLPPLEEIQAGNLPASIARRVSQEEIIQIIDCVGK